MDQRLFNAACSGDVQTLHQLLKQNPFLLSDYAILNSRDNPLTVAAKANQLDFTREVLKLNPQLALELNQDGVRPLDLASGYGNVEIVKEIMVSAGPETCQLKGRDGRTAIHYAAMNGRVEIVHELLSKCQDCIKDVTVFGESALHLAVKYYKFEVLRSLLEWMEKLNLMEIVNWEDNEGNTVLHYAALRKQIESVELLVEWNNTTGKTLKLNSVNKKGLTPADILDILIDYSNDIRLRQILHHAGACPSSELQVLSEYPLENSCPTGNTSPVRKPKTWKEKVKWFQFKWERDSPGEARQALLVVVALIATVAFQAGINPPSYLLEGPNRGNVTIYINGTADLSPSARNITDTLNEIQREPPLTVFLAANTVAFSAAMFIIDYLTVKFPFQRELRVAFFAMGVSYSCSILNSGPTGWVREVIYGVAFFTPWVFRILPNLLRKICCCGH